jgi:putative PEP-CTERM system histidine kinase
MNHSAILDFSAAVFGGGTALIAAFREKRSPAVWFFIAGMALLACENLFSGLAAASSFDLEASHWENWGLLPECLVPGVWLLFGFCYARGNYKEFVSQSKLLIVGIFIIPIGLAIYGRGELVVRAAPVALGADIIFHLTPAGWGLYLISMLGAVLVLIQLEWTFWASVGTMRWRIKFMMLGLGLLFAVRVYTACQAVVLPTDALLQGQIVRMTGPKGSTTIINAAVLLLSCLLILRSLFRRSSEVVIYPPRKGLHKSIAALVAGLYLLIVGVYGELVQQLGLTSTSFPYKSFLILVAVVGVTVLLLSDRIRLYARRFVSRYLQRPIYDYRTVWRRFTEGTASSVTSVELCQASVKLTADIFQALSVSIWLVDDLQQNFEFAASTSLSEAMTEKLRPSRDEATVILQAMQNRLEPMDLEYSQEAWAVTLRRCHPSEFEEGGSRVCVPMVSSGQLVGLMILGDRVGGVLFSLEDYDLLNCVGDQIAASLLNARLSQKLLQAKEMDAFQTMSAFFVHDLKNTASTLNLMLKNLPLHFDNPAFREDALRGMGKSVQHINSLIGRLGALRQSLQIQPAEANLNDVVTKVLANWDGSQKVQIIKNLASLPKAFFDAEQINKVVTNLVLNASEAVTGDPEIRVETFENDGWVGLRVADKGCGMTSEFLNRSLFRPFKTTKKDGFGIGMFQSKMIVEAHGGRMEVESALNEGTTFRVLLPISKPTA